MSKLRSKIEALASAFAGELLAAVKAASFEEVAGLGGWRARAAGAAPRRAAGGKRRRRSRSDILAALDDIVRVVSASAKGLRAEQIREKLGLESKEMPRVLKEGLRARRLTKKGAKRATTYFTAKGAATAKKGPRKGRKTPAEGPAASAGA